MKAAPLLRAWMHRLRAQGVRFHMRHRWLGWTTQGHVIFDTPHGALQTSAAATVLALGGGSWARLGSNGAWVDLLRQRNLAVHDLVPSNCGFEVEWTDYFRTRFAGAPLKSVALHWDDRTSGQPSQPRYQRGEFVITSHGVEGSLVYAASAALRTTLQAQGPVTVHVDLLPDRTLEFVVAEVTRPRGTRSLSTHLKSRLGLEGVKVALLHEVLSRDDLHNPHVLAQTIKALPLVLQRTRPLDEAISSAGGVCFDDLTSDLMVKQVPGLFCAGEMLNWEAPTGGYLLTACFATGRAAGLGAAHWLYRGSTSNPSTLRPS